MIALGEINYTFIEITVLPFLAVLTAFLAGRLSTTYEINRRFMLLVLTTFISAVFETSLELFPALDANISAHKIFYSLVNINAYCLMCYIAAYTRSINKTLIHTNFFMLCASVLMLFLLSTDEKLYTLFCPGFAVFFALEGFILQLVYQKYYGNGQFLVMNLLFLLLIDAFVIQYLFNQDFPLVYSIAAIMLFFTFFYLEAPTYKQLIIAKQETEDARIRTEKSIKKATIANKAKSNFLASTSHEIRTPMNAILGINEMILNEATDEETRNAALDVKKSGEYLLNLVNNILDISKIEAGKMELFENDYHLWDMLKECEIYVTERIKYKPALKFVLNADKDLSEHLYGDSLRLKQALINLLDNAAKYTEKGQITLTVSGERVTNNIKLVFTIQDTGIGMREEESQKIFDPFERANILETRHIPGAGLGLNLVRNIVEIMSGFIEIKSVYGEGTTFIMTIPQKISSGDEFTIRKYEEFLNANKQQQEEEDSAPDTWPDANILVVDDTPVNLVVAKGMLKDSQAHIDTSESGENAIDMMKEKHYDIVFLDHKMPGMDGIETLKHAKKYANGTKFIALTANSSANARAEYISYGFDDYLPKPFKSLEMMRILKSCLNKKAQS
ncbi:MAG: response regulator [Synergistaceae bacterium]|nr:response regulator [Synergistaceae bacterium]